MRLVIKRIFKGKDYTIGKMYINGEYFCDTLEDVVREGEKVYGQTAIPDGIYEIVLTMSNRFKKILPLLLKVPNFEGVRIHTGNFAGQETFYKKIPLQTDKDVLYSKEYVEVI